MPFQPGNNANPNGRPKKPMDYRSADMQEFCYKNRKDISKLRKLVLKIALKDQFPWAIKLAMEFYSPKPGTFVSVSREETKEINVMVSNFSKALTHEEKQMYLKLWMKANKGIPAFGETEPEIDEAVIEPNSADK
jgi:hypothetical protein